MHCSKRVARWTLGSRTRETLVAGRQLHWYSVACRRSSIFLHHSRRPSIQRNANAPPQRRLLLTLLLQSRLGKGRQQFALISSLMLLVDGACIYWTFSGPFGLFNRTALSFHFLYRNLITACSGCRPSPRNINDNNDNSTARGRRERRGFPWWFS